MLQMSRLLHLRIDGRHFVPHVCRIRFLRPNVPDFRLNRLARVSLAAEMNAFLHQLYPYRGYAVPPLLQAWSFPL
jgi:hypothetical protein